MYRISSSTYLPPATFPQSNFHKTSSKIKGNFFPKSVTESSRGFVASRSFSDSSPKIKDFSGQTFSNEKNKQTLPNAEQLAEKGIEAFQSGKMEESKELLLNARDQLLLSGEKAQSHLLGKVYFALGQIVLEKNNEKAISYFNLSLKNFHSTKIVLPQHDWDGSPTTLEEEKDPILASEVHAMLARASLLEGNFDQALRLFKKAYEKNSQNIDALIHLGSLNTIEGGLLRGLSYLKSAFSLDRAQSAEKLTLLLTYTLPQFYCRSIKKEAPISLSPKYSKEIVKLGERLNKYGYLINCDRYEIDKNYQECQLVFNAIDKEIAEPNLRRALTYEILLKEWAFYEQKKGRVVSLPSPSQGSPMLTYKIEHIFTLGKSIPCYGLSSTTPKMPSILLFRGTAPAFSRQGGVESVFANLHPGGVGRGIFDDALPTLTNWLSKTTTEKETGAIILGYSQGASVAAKTVVYCSKFLNQNPLYPSLTFNPPGVDPKTMEKWKSLSNKPNLLQYTVTGDVVPKCGGELIGKVFEIDTNQKHAPLNAHLEISLLKRPWKMYEVDTAKENLSSLRHFAAGFIESSYGQSIHKLLEESFSVSMLKKFNAFTSHPVTGIVFHYATELKQLISKLNPFKNH